MSFQWGPFHQAIEKQLQGTRIERISHKYGLSPATLTVCTYLLVSISVFFEYGHEWVLQWIQCTPLLFLERGNHRSILSCFVAFHLWNMVEAVGIHRVIPFYYVCKVVGFAYIVAYRDTLGVFLGSLDKE
jgi:hypothetical protein